MGAADQLAAEQAEPALDKIGAPRGNSIGCPHSILRCGSAMASLLATMFRPSRKASEAASGSPSWFSNTPHSWIRLRRGPHAPKPFRGNCGLCPTSSLRKHKRAVVSSRSGVIRLCSVKPAFSPLVTACWDPRPSTRPYNRLTSVDHANPVSTDCLDQVFFGAFGAY